MQGKRARMTKKTINNNNNNGENSSDKCHPPTNLKDKEGSQETVLTTNTFYEPTILPDYGGELFQHVDAKLRQLDIRNVENDLIPPQDWYSSLRWGTLVMS
jgi:hypothetical protein